MPIESNVRKVIDAVRDLSLDNCSRITQAIIAEKTGLSEKQVRRAVRIAIDNGWLINGETRKFCPADLAVGESSPDDEPNISQVTQWEREIERLRVELASLRERHKFATRQAAHNEAIVSALSDLIPKMKWTSPKEPQPVSKRDGTEHVVFVISDVHMGAVVDPKETPYGRYNTEVARERLSSVFRRAHTLARDYVGAKVLHLALCGDLVSGMIHEELVATNDITLPGQALEVVDVLQSELRSIVGEYEKIHVVSVSGNHGRLRKKYWHARRQHENWDYLVAQILFRMLSEIKHIEWNIPMSPWTIHDVAGYRVMFAHGDHVRPASWAGIPAYAVVRDTFRRLTLAVENDGPFDLAVIGHMHQYGILPISGDLRVVMNGSLIGVDPYADSLAVGGSPCQVLFGVHPDVGLTSVWAVYPDDVVGG